MDVYICAGPSSQAARQPAPQVSVQRSAMQGTGERGAAPQEVELPPEPTEEGEKLFCCVNNNNNNNNDLISRALFHAKHAQLR